MQTKWALAKGFRRVAWQCHYREWDHEGDDFIAAIEKKPGANFGGNLAMKTPPGARR